MSLNRDALNVNIMSRCCWNCIATFHELVNPLVPRLDIINC